MLRNLMLIGVILSGLFLPTIVHAQEPRFAQYKTPKNPKKNWFVSHKKFKATPYAVGDVSRFMFEDWSGPAIPVWAYVPTDIDVSQAPVLFMLHGAKRNPARYLLEWAPIAQENGFVVVAPEFSHKDFKGARRYNRGNVSRKKKDTYIPVDESKWSFSAIEPLFDHTIKTLGSEQTAYSIYGHSAGAQFVHRFMYYKPQARVKRFLVANSGWYTVPDLSVDYPYGLSDSGVSEDTLQMVLGKAVVVLLGDRDINMTSDSLNKSAGAMLQGEHRYNRGVTFVKVAKEQAQERNIELAWRAKRVKGVGHSNSGIAKAAASYVR